MDVGIDSNDCTVYSVGIGDDWSFDEDISKYGCNVYSFDPTIGLVDFKYSERIWFYNIGLYDDNIDNLVSGTQHWKVRSLSFIRKMLHHEKKCIDILKIDIEFGEHYIFHQLIKSDILKDIKIVAFELHLSEIEMLDHKENTLRIYLAIKTAFELNRFKLWHWHENKVMAGVNPTLRLNWIELYWINMRYID
ncbi:putative methyltransferase-like protein 24 [Saccoglossus kowalevskii]